MPRLQVSEMSTGQTNVLEQDLLDRHRTQLSTAQKTGDSTCQQEMESSMSLARMSNDIKLCVTLTLATKPIKPPGPKCPTFDKDLYTHYIIRIRMIVRTSVISEKDRGQYYLLYSHPCCTG
jgi:hypothetical protein